MANRWEVLITLKFFSCRLVPTAVYKLTNCEKLYPIHADSSDTLVLSYAFPRILHDLKVFAGDANFTSLVVMNSTYYSTFDVDAEIACSRADPDLFRPSFLNLRTLSMDGSVLCKDLLVDYLFPSVTTFELIPDSGYDLRDYKGVANLASQKLPLLEKVILPSGIFAEAAQVFRENSGNRTLVFETAIAYRWNWRA